MRWLRVRIDAYVDYSGTIWTNFMHHSESASHQKVLSEVGNWLRKKYRIELLGPLGFDNAYALVMRRDQAKRLNIRTIADLAPYAAKFSIAGDYEFFARPEWRALREAYGIDFRRSREMQSTFMYKSVADGEIDVIVGYTSDGQIAQYDLVVLGDPKQVLPPYDAILLVSPKRVDDKKFKRALRPLIGRITIQKMRDANRAVSQSATNRHRNKPHAGCGEILLRSNRLHYLNSSDWPGTPVALGWRSNRPAAHATVCSDELW